MRILFNTELVYGDCAGAISYGVVNLDDMLAKKVALYHKAILDMEIPEEDLSYLAIFDDSCSWVSSANLVEVLPIDNLLQTEMTNLGWCYLPEEIEIPSSAYQKTEGDHLMISQYGFWWRCSPRGHDKSTVETAWMGREFLQRFI